jgi:malate dehydrogenase (oxaloacetate-decarboxylating)
VPLKTRDDLSMAYTPGVARVCLAIAENPEDARRLTIKGNTVAIVTDGSAVLGLGTSARGGLPVMEGKAVLFKRFAGIDAWPVCLDTTTVDEIVRVVEAIAPVYGGINLEDISAPRCFEIEAAAEGPRHPGLPRRPARHRHRRARGPLLNALRLVDKRIEEVTVAMSGAGAAGRRRRASCCSARGVGDVDRRRPPGIHPPRRPRRAPSAWLAEHTNRAGRTGTLKDALVDADVFIGCLGPGTSSSRGTRGRWPRTRSCSPWPTRPRGRPRRGRRARRGRGHGSQRLPQPDQQRAGVPGGVPRSARCPGDASSPRT